MQSGSSAPSGSFESEDRCPFSGNNPSRKRDREAHYGCYLQLGPLLRLQDGPSGLKPPGVTIAHHEEMTFIVVHQTFELWFKLVIGDLNVVRNQLRSILDNPMMPIVEVSSVLYRCHPLLRRVEMVLQHATASFDIIETMHPAEFLEFRDFLIPASGFQSVQWRVIEEVLGINSEKRTTVNGKHVYEYLHDDERSVISEASRDPSMLQLFESLMERLRIPDMFIPSYIDGLKELLYYRERIADGERTPEEIDQAVDKQVKDMEETLRRPHAFYGEKISEEVSLTFDKAVRAAIFAQSYRHDPQLAPLSELLDLLLAVESATLLWRSRHIQMVSRIIGTRAGTGGTISGTTYLESTRRYRIFKPLWMVRRLFLRASVLPSLESLKPSPNLLGGNAGL